LTYCLGILLPEGLVLAADSRSNAGIDQIARVHKLAIFHKEAERVIAILSAGNLATTQMIVTALREALGSGDYVHDLHTAETMFEAAKILGHKLREVMEHESKYVEPYGDPSASFLIGGQILGEKPRLFEIYNAGNFIEASERACFLQIGETKYGKPILDRALHRNSRLDEAAKLALLSFDATIRSNLSVGLPIDMLRYDTDSYCIKSLSTLEAHNAYWTELRQGYSEGIAEVIARLPAPPALCGLEGKVG